MKFQDCNAHQKLAWRLANEIYCDIVGGLENAMLDNPKDSEEYKRAERALKNPEVLVNMIYGDVQRTATMQGNAKHIRFAGEDWTRERIARRLAKDGYYPNFVKNEMLG